MQCHALYMAVVVIAWAFAAFVVGAATILLAEMATEFYKEHFSKRR